jgi:hypothetical protein
MAATVGRSWGGGLCCVEAAVAKTVSLQASCWFVIDKKLMFLSITDLGMHIDKVVQRTDSVHPYIIHKSLTTYQQTHPRPGWLASTSSGQPRSRSILQSDSVSAAIAGDSSSAFHGVGHSPTSRPVM